MLVCLDEAEVIFMLLPKFKCSFREKILSMWKSASQVQVTRLPMLSLEKLNRVPVIIYDLCELLVIKKHFGG